MPRSIVSPDEIIDEERDGRNSSRSHSESSSTNNRRVIELIPPWTGDNRQAHNSWVIRQEFYDEDIADRDDDDEYFDIDEYDRMDDLSMRSNDTDYDDDDDDDDEVGNQGMISADELDTEADEDEVNYDQSLPVTHSYLGDDLEESRGRQVLNPGSPVKLMLLNIENIVLFPGQTLPLHSPTLNDRTNAFLKHCITNNNTTVGIISNPQRNKIGTTADIRNYSFSTDNTRTIIILEGRQRFELLSGGFEYAMVGQGKILPEVNLGCPYSTRSSIARHYSFNTPNRFIVSKHPPWVLKSYDAKTMIVKILYHIQYWTHIDYNATKCYKSRPETTSAHTEETNDKRTDYNGYEQSTTKSPKISGEGCSSTSTTQESKCDENGSDENNRKDHDTMSKAFNFSKDPIYFSHWLASNLALSNEDRLKILSMDCVEVRLAWLLKILESSDFFCCVLCKTKICRKRDAFSMSRLGPQCTYVNESGAIHDTLTVRRVQDVILDSSKWSQEFSWFPGYEWVVLHCKRCAQHIGWCFRRVDPNISPRLFYGLSRRSIELIKLGFVNSTQQVIVG